MSIADQEEILSAAYDRLFSAIPEAAECRKRRSSEPVKKEVKNISVSFVKKEHGDPFPFDGAGGSIGHVIFPPSSTSKYRTQMCSRDNLRSPDYTSLLELNSFKRAYF